MENQTMEDKLGVLTNIFGQDLTDDTIENTLKENNYNFDATVEKLLTLPPNKPKEVQPAPQPMDPKSKDNITRLQNMFGDLTQSVITTVYESNKRDVEGTLDTLLNLTSNEVASGSHREAEVARQEEEIKAYEEFKKAQQRLQEEDRKQTEAAQQSALVRAKEEEQRRKEEAQRREVEKKAMDEHSRALQEQEKMLVEFQRKKEEQNKLKRDEEEAKKKAADEQEKIKRLEDEKVKLQKEKERLERLEKERLEKERLERLEKERLEKERLRSEKERLERLGLEKERLEKERLEKEKAETDAKAKQAADREKEREVKEKRLAEERRIQEEAIAMKRLVEQNEMLQRQTQQAEAERKLIEARMLAEMKREEEEKKRLLDTEKRFKEEQDNIRRDWEEKVKKLEGERRVEEQKRFEEETKRLEAKRLEDEERARQEADMRRVLELERLKLDEQRKRIDEEKKSGEARLKAMEDAARQREEEEAKRLKIEEERQKAEEERKREEEERARLLQEEAQARERIKEDLRKALAQEQFAASAILVEKAVDEPTVTIVAELDGVDSIKGTWTLVSGVLPPSAWLGLFARRAMNTNSGYMYISGASGEFHFKGLTPGHYEARVFLNKPVTTRIAESAPVLVGPKVVNFSLQQQNSQLMLEYTLDPPASPSSRDWVGVYDRSQRRNKVYITSVYGTNSGMISVPQPKGAGDYEVRLFVTGAKYNDQASAEFSVPDNDRVSGEVVDGVIKASWVLRTQDTTTSDWIGLFPAGEISNNNNNKYLASVYTNALSEGSVDIPIPKDAPKGLYELRLFSSKVGKYIPFKTSDVIALN